jgi:hypothetical protein
MNFYFLWWGNLKIGGRMTLRTTLHDLDLGNLRFSIAFGISAVNAAEIRAYLPLLPPL